MGDRVALTRYIRTTLNEEGARESAVRHQRGVRPGDRTHAGNRAKALADPIVERTLFRGVVPVQRGADLEQDDVPGIEAEVHVSKVLQRAEEQPRADEEHERDGDLRDDERPSEQAA